MDKITILQCQGRYKATKQFSQKTDGTIEKVSFSAGRYFNCETKNVSSLRSLSEVLDELADSHESFVIRGEPNATLGKLTRRKKENFAEVPRHYVMLDVDKLACPAHFSATDNPDEIVGWVLAHLPEPFQRASCYYKFSASQNISTSAAVSIHLWFWLDRPVSGAEWKVYLKQNQAPVDLSLFSSVQIHYTAKPIFTGMEDPLPKRSGILSRQSDAVIVPDIAEPKRQKTIIRPEREPQVTPESCEKAIELVLPYYKEGKRNKLCAAITGSMYRGGWSAENAANFVFELAERAEDEELDARYGSALRICDAIDRGNPAQGIPTLREEIEKEQLDGILRLLGIGAPDINTAISELIENGTLAKIKEVLGMIVTGPESEQKSCVDKIKKITGQPKSVLNDLLNEVKQEINSRPADWPDIAMERMLTDRFNDGCFLLRASDGQYWKYNGRYWEVAQKEDIKNKLLPYARDVVDESRGESGGVSYVMRSVLEILEGRVYRGDNPLHSQDVPAVINCLNGELWFDSQGRVSLRPHRPESYLKHCLSVDYDPRATSPLFDKAVLDIFAKSTNPADMVRHFTELAGYICQPWRKIPIIVLFYGHGRNGKSSLMGVIKEVLGAKMIMSDRIGNIEEKDFKVGALDGKLLLLDDDVDEGVCLPDGFLKKISEEKLMSGQHKHKPIFEFVCRAVPVMIANNYPAIKDLSDGIWRRIIIIPFMRQLLESEDKRGLFDEIWQKEASGILNRFVEGFQRLRERGRFEEPDDCLKAKNEWLRRSNILPAFIEESCEPGERFVQALGTFYAAFREYCSINGVRYVPSQNTVGERLVKLGYGVTLSLASKYLTIQ